MTLPVFPSPQAESRPWRLRPASKLGRAVPSAPWEVAQTRPFQTSSHPRRALRTARPAPDLFGQRAFSLIEIIAVLAIIAIIAAAALPALIQRIDYTAQATEAANLGTFAAGLTQAISRQRSIPKQADLATFIAASIGWQPSAVLINAANNPRVFLIDPSLVIATTTLTTQPYQQTNNGAITVQSPRFIIVSSLSSPLPAGLSAATDFTSLWNNPDNTIPATPTWNGWKGHGGDIRIQRINLASSFNLLTLTDSDPILSAPYNIDAITSSSVSVPPNTTVSAYFLRGTVVNLYYYQVPAMNVTTQAFQVLQQDVSWVFSSGLWRNAPVPVSPQPIVQNFYTNAPNPYSTNAPNPIKVYSDMTSYMGLYDSFAASGFTNFTIKGNLQAACTNLNRDLSLILSH
jgi:prepilin-type N-terminal cleavage/methylation domain-containing protein